MERVLGAAAPDAAAEFEVDARVMEALLPELSVRGLHRMSRARRLVCACLLLEAEVNNGGFLQFFDNGGPVAAREALVFLDERGPRPVATLLRRAIRAFPGGALPRTRRQLERITLADCMPDLEPGPLCRKLDKITVTFFAGGYGPAMIRRRLEFVRDHAGEFFA